MKIIFIEIKLKSTQTERISFNFISLVPSKNILCTVDYHAWDNVYHLLKKTIYPYQKPYHQNIFKSFFNWLKTILLNGLRSHWAQYQHLRGHGALRWLSLLIIFYWNFAHILEKKPL